MRNPINHGMACTALALIPGLAQAHHEAASAINGEGVALLGVVLTLCVSAFLLRSRS